MRVAYREIGSELDLDLASAYLRVPRPLTRIFPRGCVKPLLAESGRSALRAALSCWMSEKRRVSRFLLPIYLCSAVLQPFKELGIACDFYRIGSNLDIDWEDAARKLNSGLYSGFLYICYFGSSVHSAPPVGFFDQWPNVTIIEDLAQALLSRGAGCRGDYTIYSLRKWVGVPDGGAVIVSSRNKVPTLSNCRLDFVKERLVAFELRCRYRLERLRSKESYLKRFRDAEGILETDRGGALGISALSVRILRTTNFRHIATARRQNFKYLMTHFPVARGVDPLSMTWAKSDVPLGFPVVCSRRDWLRNELRKNGIYCPVHWILPEVIRSLPDASSANALSDCLLTLPCDQRYTEDDMEYIVSCLKSALRKSSGSKQNARTDDR